MGGLKLIVIHRDIVSSWDPWESKQIKISAKFYILHYRGCDIMEKYIVTNSKNFRNERLRKLNRD